MSQPNGSRSRSNIVITTSRKVDRLKASVSVTSIAEDKQTVVSQSDVRNNRELITFVWLDLHSQSTPTFIGSLRAINDYVRTYTDLSTCFDVLKTLKTKVFFISSPVSEEWILKFHTLDNVVAIFILDANAQPIENEYPKLFGVVKQHEELTQLLKEILDTFQQLQVEAFIFEQDNEFLWMQLWKEEVMNRKVAANSKNDFLQIIRSYYHSNPRRLRLIDDFEQAYRPKDALQWYFRNPFPSHLLRHAFMSYDFAQLALCRFLIADASRVIQQQAKRNGRLQLYRGMKLPNKLIDKFEMHTDKLVCTTGFFACTKSRALALDLASTPTYRSDLSSVLFKIECDSSIKVGELSIDNRGMMSILDVGVTFRIVFVNRGTVSVVKMKTAGDEGKRLAQEYRSRHKGFTIATLLTQLLDQPKPLTPLPKITAPSRGPLKRVVVSESKLSKEVLEAEEHVKRGEIDSAIAIYRSIQPTSVAILLLLGQLYAEKKGDYDNALSFYSQALKIQQKAGEDISDTITRIGSIHHERREFVSALTCHACALRLRESVKPPNLAAIATNLVGIANAHRANQELTEALSYAKRALEMRESIIPANETNVGTSLATLANIYHELGDDTEALRVGMRAFDIFQRVLGPNSTELAGLLNNLGAIKLSQGDIREARKYFERSISIYREILPPEHPYIGKLENNIRCVSEMEQNTHEGDEEL